jgi:hypothetical protein
MSHTSSTGDHARMTVMTVTSPSFPASLQTLGRGECVAAGAPASHGLRIISPLPAYLNSLRAIWTVDKKFGSELSFHLSTVVS